MTNGRTYRFHECAWCGAKKPTREMRHPSASKGKASAVCYQCRLDHPDHSWCNFHGEPHPVGEFQVVNRPIPYNSDCRAAAVIKASRARAHAPIDCVSCGVTLESWNFRGGRQKAPACRSCETANLGKRWCMDCDAWLDESRFNRTGVGGKFWTTRCTPCKVANSHGVTIAHILALQGSLSPECAACGSVQDLRVDHDHACCPTGAGCKKCVRGYLCHDCNIAEGTLRTPERARLLAVYMENAAIKAGKSFADDVA